MAAAKMTLAFEGPDLTAIANQALAWANDYLGVTGEVDVLKKKARELVYGISQNSCRHLEAMVDIALSGQVPTPPLVMVALGPKPGDEQGVRAVCGKVRSKMELLDATMGGPPLLEKAPFVNEHTQYHFGDHVAELVKAEIDGLEGLLKTIKKPS